MDRPSSAASQVAALLSLVHDDDRWPHDRPRDSPRQSATGFVRPDPRLPMCCTRFKHDNECHVTRGHFLYFVFSYGHLVLVPVRPIGFLHRRTCRPRPGQAPASSAASQVAALLSLVHDDDRWPHDRPRVSPRQSATGSVRPDPRLPMCCTRLKHETRATSHATTPYILCICIFLWPPFPVPRLTHWLPSPMNLTATLRADRASSAASQVLAFPLVRP